MTVHMEKSGADYVGYEYTTRTVPKELASMYLDAYPQFGWEQDANRPMTEAPGHVTLNFKRDRCICNKMELTRLQRSFDGCVGQIIRLEQSKRTMPTLWAITVGVIGGFFLAVSVMAVSGEVQHWLACAVFGVPGLCCWAAPYFLYRALVGRQIDRLSPLIEEKYDELYEICEKAAQIKH